MFKGTSSTHAVKILPDQDSVQGVSCICFTALLYGKRKFTFGGGLDGRSFLHLSINANL